MHAVREELLDLQAEAAGLPLWKVPLPWPCPDGTYEALMRGVLDRCRAEGVHGVAYGDLFLEDVRAYREARHAGTGIQVRFPLWGLPTADLAHTMVAGGLKAILTCVDPGRLDARFAGRDFDAALLADLPAAVDPCGSTANSTPLPGPGPCSGRPCPSCGARSWNGTGSSSRTSRPTQPWPGSRHDRLRLSDPLDLQGAPGAGLAPDSRRGRLARLVARHGKVEVLEPGDAQGIGSLRRFTWKGTLPYRLRFNLRATRIDAPSLIEGDACGELEGVGRWLLRQDGAWTTVRYDWNVRTTKAWMNWFAFLLKGPFRRNHDRVMGWGAEACPRSGWGANGNARADPEDRRSPNHGFLIACSMLKRMPASPRPGPRPKC